jgi:lysophospholipase L1-like esterase
MKKLLFFIPAIALLLFSFQMPKRTIFMVGDSTMANKSAKAFPETGWGQAMAMLADSTKITIDNHAKNGRSTKSFIDEGLWAAVERQIKPGDYVFIQFGHNDEKIDKPKVYARAATAYKVNLKKMVDETRAKGGVPVLFSSIVRRDFAPNGKLNDTHGEYIEAVKQLAEELKVTFIDLEAETHLLVEKMGPDESSNLYMNLPQGIYPNHPEGLVDNTHLTRYGAMQVACLAIKHIKTQLPELACCF